MQSIKIILIVFGVIFNTVFAWGEDLVKLENALRQIFPQAEQFRVETFVLSADEVVEVEKAADVIFVGTHNPQILRHAVLKNEQLLGYVYEDRVMGKWGLIHYVVGVDLDGVIIQTMVLDYQEIRGRPIAKSRFQKQFKGKSLSESLRLKKDIDGITGATISSRSYTDGVRKILNIHKLYRNHDLAGSI